MDYLLVSDNGGREGEREGGEEGGGEEVAVE